MSRQRRTYTVIVGRPDYVSDYQLSDTYMTSIKALSAELAGLLAQAEAADQDSFGEDDPYNPDDYVVVAVIRGKHDDIKEREDL